MEIELTERQFEKKVNIEVEMNLYQKPARLRLYR